MTKREVQLFIEIMREIREEWTPEQVEEEYGDLTLKEAVYKRMNKMQTFWDFVEEVVKPDIERMRSQNE